MNAAGTPAPTTAEQPTRRRRRALTLLAAAVLGVALLTPLGWLLPYDATGLLELRRRAGWPGLGTAELVWAWAGAALALLARLAWLPRASGGLALATGLVLGSAYLAAGGSAAALTLLLVAAVASLGWQAQRQGGLALLLGTALGAAGWDLLLSARPTLWLAAVVLVGMSLWLEREHERDGTWRPVEGHVAHDMHDTRGARGDELRLTQDARTRLLASVSHDLRQPLQAMRLYAEALSGRPETDARSRELLRRQMQAGDDAVAMLDQFSEYSAIEQGMLVSHPERVDLRELLDRVAATLQATHARDILRLTVHGRRDTSWVWLDRSQLARVVQNLAGNAVRYSAGLRAQGPARVVLAVRPQRGDLAIDVLDNGRGIPADQIERIFEPYVQLPLATRGGESSGGSSSAGEAARAGRGLGLAIVRGLVAQLGLALAPVASVPGRGTRFRVVVPAALRRAPATPSAATEASTAGRLDARLLALLDDEDAPRSALRAALEGLGAAVVDAPSLALLEARLDAEARYPDALVFDLDLGSGVPDGRAALAELRQKWELVVPAVILTGRVGSRSLILPPRCTLHEKPVALADLVATLERLVPRSPLR